MMDEANVWVRLVLALLATWRLTHLLAHEDGFADIVVRFRALLGQSLAGKVLDCFNCLSLWIAAPLALFITQRPLEWLFGWLALSGGACLLERLTYEPASADHAIQNFTGDLDHVLRSKTFGAVGHPYGSGDAEHIAKRDDGDDAERIGKRS
jgi:hypothetical protein